jgi:hypothetical protein
MQMPGTCDPLLRGFALSLKARVEQLTSELWAGPLGETAVSERLSTWKAQIGAVVDEAVAANPAQLSRATWENEVARLSSTLAAQRAPLV